MTLGKPILFHWQTKSKTAQFVRRHRWFFEMDVRYGSFFLILGVFVPAAFALLALRDTLRAHTVLAFGFLVAVLVYMVASFVLVQAALEIDGKHDKR